MSRDEEYAVLVTEAGDLAGEAIALEDEWSAFQREYTEEQQRWESDFSQAQSQAYAGLRTFHEHLRKKLASIRHTLDTRVPEKKLSRDRRHAACVRDMFAELGRRCEETRATREALAARARTLRQRVAATHARAEDMYRQSTALRGKLRDQETRMDREAADARSAIETLVEGRERMRERMRQGYGASLWASGMSAELFSSLSAEMAGPETSGSQHSARLGRLCPLELDLRVSALLISRMGVLDTVRAGKVSLSAGETQTREVLQEAEFALGRLGSLAAKMRQQELELESDEPPGEGEGHDAEGVRLRLDRCETSTSRKMIEHWVRTALEDYPERS